MARPIKPTHLKVVSGTAQKCRTNPNEPKPERARLSPPAHVSNCAREVWGTVALILDEMGVLTKADVLAMEGLCEAYAELQKARSELDELGSLTYETTNQSGDTMWRARPQVAMVSDADRRFRMWLAAVGMTPADRSRVSAAPAEKKNAFADFG